jgi:rRNA processing protein Krr1/Pno1
VGIELVETADEEVSNQAIEIARIVAEQNPEAVTKTRARLVGEEGQV